MRDDALPIRRIVFVGAGIACAVAVAIAAVLGLLSHRRMPVGGKPVAGPAPLGGDLPMLQAAPQLDLAAYRHEKSRALDQIGWIDAASGVAHLPIDVAMANLVRQGVASVPKGNLAAARAPLPAVSGHAASLPTMAPDPSPSGQASEPMGKVSGAPR